MNLTISGHHLEVTPALRSYVTSKLDRITRHFDQVVDVKVLLSVEKQKERKSASVQNATSMSRAAICLPKAPMPICMPPWMSWWTRWTGRWCATRIGFRTTTPMRVADWSHDGLAFLPGAGARFLVHRLQGGFLCPARHFRDGCQAVHNRPPQLP